MIDVEHKVFVILSQRLGSDVREGKRRQFNYIGTQIYSFLSYYETRVVFLLKLAWKCVDVVGLEKHVIMVSSFGITLIIRVS